MSTVTESSISTFPAAEPLPSPPGLQMVPVDFAPPDPLPPPPRKENAMLIHFGTGLAALGSGVLIVALFITPWFFVREVSIVQPPPQAQGQGGAGNSQPSFSSFAPRLVQRDIHDFGVVSWASTRRVKRDIGIVGFALIASITVLMSSVSYRWRPFLAFAALAGLVVQILTLIDYTRLSDLIRERVSLASTSFNSSAVPANALKIVGTQPGTGMVVLFIGAACVVFGSLIALLGGRRGKVLAPVTQ